MNKKEINQEKIVQLMASKLEKEGKELIIRSEEINKDGEMEEVISLNEEVCKDLLIYLKGLEGKR